MAGFELERLDYDRRNPHGRLELLRAYGTRLHEKVFASRDVRRVWQEYRERSRLVVLCLRIHDEVAGLEALPWETLHDGEEFIAGGPTTEITRLSLGVEAQGTLPALSFPLRLLSFASSPLNLKENERLNVEAEQEILLRGVNDPAGQGKLLVDFEDEARREILEGSLDGGGYHILHFTGHGVSPRNSGGLLFEDAEGKGRRISIEDFLQSLDKAQGSLRLAVISGCNTARTLYTGSFRDLARGILAARVPAVAAMQFSLSDAGGLKFAEAFYPELIAGKPPEHLFWPEQGRKMLTDSVSLTAVREAAKSLMTGLGAMQAIYIGVLGFAEFTPKTMESPLKWFFAVPPMLWLIALYLCVKVQKTEGMEVRLKAPNEIRDRLQQLVRDKQHDLDIAFWLLLAGLVTAVVLLVWRRMI